MNEKGHVLVVDDDISLRETFEAFLMNDGYHVTTADNYESTLQCLERNCFDVIFADICLGGQTGIEILSEIKRRGVDCPVIMITGYPDVQSAKAAVHLHTFDYLSKPVLRQPLLEATQRAIQHKREFQQKEQICCLYDDLQTTAQRGILTVNSHMQVTFANDAIKQFLKQEPSELIGKPLVSCLEKTKRICQPLLERCFQEKDATKPLRTIWTASSGEKQTVMMTAKRLSNSKKSNFGAVLFFDEIEEPDKPIALKTNESTSFHGVVGRNHKMFKIYAIMTALARTDSTVLISGETGTGKGRVAETLHETSPWSKNPLVTVTCSALSESLLESELFGHVQGAFTGAIRDKIGRVQMAEGGTLFLDEIGDISPAIQVKLLRLIEEKKFERVGDPSPMIANIRIIAATNHRLMQLVKKGQFRADLYYRLKVMDLVMPPLRDRVDDIPLLCDHFRKHFNHKLQKRIIPFSPLTMDIFNAYDWPGNVRQLKHAIEHAFILAEGDEINPGHLPPEMIPDFSPVADPACLKPSHLNETNIRQALRQSGWNKSKAARLLGMGRQTLYRKMCSFGIAESDST